MKNQFYLPFLFIFIFNPTSLNAKYFITNHENQYLVQFEKQFNLRDFKSCIRISYLLANSSDVITDCEKCTELWYNISYLYLMLGKNTEAEHSEKMAEYFARRDHIETHLYKDIYQGILHYENKEFTLAHDFLKHISNATIFPNQKLIELLKIMDADATDRIHILTKEQQHLRSERIIRSLKLNKDTNWFGYPLVYYNLGNTYYTENRFKEYLEAFKKCIHQYERLHIYTSSWMDSYIYLITDYGIIQDQFSREASFKKVMTLINLHHNYLQTHLPDYFLLKANLYFSHSDYAKALDLYIHCYKDPKLSKKYQGDICKKIITSLYFNNQPNNLISWYQEMDPKYFSDIEKLYIANAYYQLGFTHKAKKLIQSVENKLNRYNSNYLEIISLLASDYTALQNIKKAEYYYKLSLKYELIHLNRINLHTCLAYTRLGYFYWVVKSDFKNAMKYYHKAEYSLLRCPYSDNYFALPDISKSINDPQLEIGVNNVAETLYQLAKHCQSKSKALQYLKASLDHFKLSISLIEKIKRNLPDEDQRLVYSDLTKRKYPNIIKVCLELYKKTKDLQYAKEAFEYAEKSKASLLLSMVQGVNANNLHLIPSSLQNEDDSIRDQMVFLTRQRVEEYHKPKPDYTKLDKINMALYRTQFSHDSLVTMFKNQYPAYYNMRYNTKVTTPEHLQKILAPNEAVLQYSVTWDFMVLFVVTRNQFRIFTDTIGKPFFADVEQYRKRLSSFDYTQLNDTSALAFARLSHRLYRHLIQPALPWIGHKKLMVIPDDLLNQIPFEALVQKVPDTKRKAGFRDLDYLIRNHPVSYSYSATLYALDPKITTYLHARLLAVAPSYGGIAYKNELDRDLDQKRSNTMGLSTIAGTYAEARSISRIFSGTELLRTRATEKRFKQMAGNYDIIHLAMHGVIDNESPMFSKLIFAPPPKKDSLNDGFLNTFEIYNMQLHAPLVVLSACNTGAGKLHTGEGIISLARGFFTAGARCVVMTLWSVADKSSSQLMKYFYQDLAQKQPVCLALQHAKLNYLDHADMVSAHPYFWAGYVATGNTNVSFSPPRPDIMLRIIETVILLLLLGVIFYIRRSRHSG